MIHQLVAVVPAYAYDGKPYPPYFEHYCACGFRTRNYEEIKAHIDNSPVPRTIS